MIICMEYMIEQVYISLIQEVTDNLAIALGFK